MDTPWYDIREEFLGFTRALIDGSDYSARDLWYLLEKPWHWTPDYEAWVAAGRPETVSS